jgi:hypothetical protein
MRLLVLFVALFSEIAFCRGPLTGAEERAWYRAELQEQELKARELAVESDVVFIGTVVAIARESETVAIEATRVLKGAVARSTTWPLPKQRIVISSRPSLQFRNTSLDVGVSYILYVKNGAFLRAGLLKRSDGELSLRRESRIVKAAGRGT